LNDRKKINYIRSVRIPLSLLFVMTVNISISQYNRTRTIHIDTFATGNVFLYKTIKKVQLKEFKLHEFYLKEDVREKYFYPSGNKSTEVQRITKKGTYGKFCFEIKFEQKEYYNNGKLKSREINLCDCYKVKKYQYDEEGGLTSFEYTKNRWIKRKMD